MVVRHVVIDQTWFNQFFNQMVVHIPLREYYRIPPTLQIIHDTCGGTQGDDAEAANRQDTSTERRTSHGKYLLGFQQLPAAAKLPNSARGVVRLQHSWAFWLISEGRAERNKGHGNRCRCHPPIASVLQRSALACGVPPGCFLFRAHLSQIPVQDLNLMYWAYTNTETMMSYGTVG